MSGDASEVSDSDREMLRLPRGGTWYYLQKYMLKHSPDEALRVCWDKKKWDKKQSAWVVVKVYGSYSAPGTIFENMGNNGAAIWGYEFITADRPCQVHLDFDGYGLKDGDHSTLRRRLKELRAFLESKFGIHRVGINVWCGSRETAKGYKNSYHVVIHTLHVANNEVLKHLIHKIWPGETEGGIDRGIYTRNRPFRLPGCSKLALSEDGVIGEDVPLTLITNDPFDPDDVLSPAALPDTDFKASERSLITVIDSDSTLLEFKVEPKSGKREREGVEQTSGRETRRVRVAQPHTSDATISPGRVEDVALTLVRTHPRIGSGHAEWFRTLCAILNEAGYHSDVVLIAVEYSRIREGYQGASDVEGRFHGLQLRESGGSKVTMGSLAKWATENPALVFNTTENSSGLRPVEGVGVNKVWANKLDQMLRRVDTTRTSCKWLIQCVSYLAHHADLQMRSWVQQHYPQVGDEEFKTIWCLQKRSDYYEKALKTYVLQSLEEIGTPRSKRARMASDSGKEGAGSKQQAVWQDPKPVASQSDKDDGRGTGAGYKQAGASSTSKHCTAKQDSVCWMEEDAASSSHGVEPGFQDSEPVSDASLTEEAPATGTCHSASAEPVAGAAASHLPSPAVQGTAQESVPMVQDGGAHGVQDDEPMVEGCEHGVQAAQESDLMVQDGGAHGVQDDEPMVEGCEHGDQDFEQMSQDDESMVEGCEYEDQDFEQVSQDGEPVVQGAAQESDPTVQVYDFENLSTDNRAKVTKHIHVKHLTADMIDPSKDCFIQSGYKTGKSHATHAFIKQNKLSVLSIVNLRSLKDGFLEKFADCNVLSYDDPKFRDKFTPGRSVVITLDSLKMLESVDFQAKDYVVFCDELHSLTTYLSSSTTLADKRSSVMSLYAQILRNAKQIIGVDNDICDVAFDFITKTIQRNQPCEFIMNSYKSYDGVHATEIPSMEGMETRMYRLMCDDMYFTTCFNSRRQAERVVQSLKERCEKDGVDPAKIKLFTSKDGARITDINEQWGNCWVFYSPVIVTGRDFNPETEATTFCYVDGTQSLSPEECVQQLARNRNMKHLYYHLEHVDAVTPHFKTEADIKEAYRTERMTLKAMSVYRQVCTRGVSACGDACETENVHTDMVCKVAYRRHLMACNFRYHFIKILTKTGFQVEESEKPSSGYGKEKIKDLDKRILVEKGLKIEAFIEKISVGVPVSSDDVFDATAQRHVDILQLPLEEEVIRRYKDEVFGDEPFQQHLNVRRLTLSKEVLGNIVRDSVKGDGSFNAPQTPLMKVAVFCEIIRWCVPDCSSVLQLQVTLGSKDEVPIPEGVLDLWKMLVLNERLKQGKTTQIPENKKKLIQSLVKTAKSLFGEDFFMPAEHTQPRRNGKRTSESCYTVNSEWVERQMELFRYSAYTQREKLDIEIEHRYGLLRALEYSDPNKDATEQIHICEPMDCSKALEDPELEQKRSELWAGFVQQPPTRVCAPDKDEAKRSQASEEDRLKAMRVNNKRFFVSTDF